MPSAKATKKEYEKRKKELEKEVLKVIADHPRYCRHCHLFNDLSFSQRTYYDYELHKLHNIKEALQRNKKRVYNDAFRSLCNQGIISGDVRALAMVLKLTGEPDEVELLKTNPQITVNNGQANTDKIPDRIIYRIKEEKQGVDKE